MKYFSSNIHTTIQFISILSTTDNLRQVNETDLWLAVISALFAADFTLLHHIQETNAATICKYAMHILHIRICAHHLFYHKISVVDNIKTFIFPRKKLNLLFISDGSLAINSSLWQPSTTFCTTVGWRKIGNAHSESRD